MQWEAWSYSADEYPNFWDKLDQDVLKTKVQPKTVYA